MKKYIFGLVFLLAGSLPAQVITGFGNSSDFNPTVAFGGGDVAGSLIYTISGFDNGSQLFGSVTSVFVGTPSVIYLTATQSTNLTSNFQIELFDSAGNGVLYQASWSSFTQNTEVTVPLTFLAQDSGNSQAFNGTVTSIGLLTSGLGSTLTVTLNTLSAVPEPATYAAIIGLASLGFCAVRRRRRA